MSCGSLALEVEFLWDWNGGSAAFELALALRSFSIINLRLLVMDRINAKKCSVWN